jgi:pimeloyl-ACP methyl ester carboxylesterase
LKQIFPKNLSSEDRQAVLDIVFIHGLGGDLEKTWQLNANTFWPQWIADDFANCDVFVAGYNSSKFAGALSGRGASIQDISSILADELISRESRALNLLLICHSLGGLVAKQMLRKCEDSSASDFNDLGRCIKGIVFMGTPHQGSNFASAINAILNDFTSTQAKQLEYSDAMLVDLNEHFRSLVNRRSVEVKSFYETQKTWGIQVVDKVTGNPGVVGSEPIAVQTDHIKICKPKSKDDKVYKSVCATVRKLLTDHCPSAGSEGQSCETSVNDAKHDPKEVSNDCSPVILSDYAYFTTKAEEDRRSLEAKLIDANRSYLYRDARRKKERFAMELRSRIAQPAAITRYTKLMSDVETRYKRHVSRVIAENGSAKEIDEEIQSRVIEPCVELHSTADHEITSKHVDEALYFLAGNCHLAWDND